MASALHTNRDALKGANDDERPTLLRAHPHDRAASASGSGLALAHYRHQGGGVELGSSPGARVLPRCCLSLDISFKRDMVTIEASFSRGKGGFLVELLDFEVELIEGRPERAR